MNSPVQRPASRILPPAVTGLGLKLGLATAVVVCAVVGAGAASSYVRERDRLLESMQNSASTQARLTLTGLQFAMLENDRTLLHDLVEQYARSVEVDRVFVTDATGNVAISSAPPFTGKRVTLPADVCPTCALPAGARPTRTAVETVEGRRVLRSLTVIANDSRCLRCHPREQRTLGTLAVDFSMAPVDQARDAMVTWLVLWGVAVALLVLVAVGAVVQLGALAPLRRLRDAARSALPGPARSDAGPLRDEIGELAHDFSRVSTALQDSQAQVDRQRRFLVDLLDHVEDGVAVLDRSLTVVAANQAYLTRVGCDRSQVGRGQLRCGDTALCGQTEGECPTRNAFRKGLLQKRIARHLRGERETFVEVFASPIAGAGGEVEQVVEIWRDVTERVALQANLARSEQLAAVGTLASGFSHEISTPLGTVSNSIQGMLRILGERESIDPPETAALRQRLEVASREVFRCRDITRSLLDLGRRRRTVRDRVQAGEVAARMIEAVRATAERQGVSIAFEAAKDAPAVLARADELEQVMLNLLMNALEAMPQGGTLSVAVRAAGAGVEVIVSDTGPGIGAEAREHIFEPFFTGKAGGTGLGLYLSRQLVEANGGRLELLPGPGGARFRVFLPEDGGAS